jgi:hypothetical protein
MNILAGFAFAANAFSQQNLRVLAQESIFGMLFPKPVDSIGI